jgi:hypothetical protein
MPVAELVRYERMVRDFLMLGSGRETNAAGARASAFHAS